MDPRALITELVPQVTRNASVVEIEEREAGYAVTIAGTSPVTAQCEVPRGEVRAALSETGARAHLGLRLKMAADTTVAAVPDGRG